MSPLLPNKRNSRTLPEDYFEEQYPEAKSYSKQQLLKIMLFEFKQLPTTNPTTSPRTTTQNQQLHQGTIQIQKQTLPLTTSHLNYKQKSFLLHVNNHTPSE